MDDLIETAMKRNAANVIHGAVGALADAQAEMVTTLLEQGLLTSLAAQQMIDRLHNKKYSNPPLNDAESARRHLVRLIADRMQEEVEWDRAADQK